MTKCAIYARVSTAEQIKGYSIAAQLDTCRVYLNSHGWRLTGDLYRRTPLLFPLCGGPMLRLISPLILAMVIIVFVAGPVFAQEPCVGSNFDTNTNGWQIRPDLNSGDWGTQTLDPNPLLNWSSFVGGSLNMASTTTGSRYVIAASGPLSIGVGPDTELRIMRTNNPVDIVIRVRFSDDTTAILLWTAWNASAGTLFSLDLSDHAGKTITAIEVRGAAASTFSINFWYFCFLNAVDATPPAAELCPAVQNAHFSAADGWLLAGGSVISDGLLSLPTGGQIAQNLTLTSLTTYNAVISTSATTAIPTDLSVTLLGTQNQTVSITGSGRFTTSFTTASVSGPILYTLENIGSNGVDLDFTCVAVDTGSSSTGECIAPPNGNFDQTGAGDYPLAADWSFFRGASWNSTTKNVKLPFKESQELSGLIKPIEIISLPVLTTGQHLLLSYDAKAEMDTGILGTALFDDPGGWYETFANVYQTFYTYEFDISSMDDSDVELMITNPGYDPVTETTLEGSILLDNVCIFVANRGPRLPFPTDQNSIDPVDLGFNYTSCDDIDGILAGFGVNIQQHRAEYEAGVSLWDYAGWVPWLVAAFWTILAMYLCVFMAAFVVLIDLLEYILNNFLNVAMWLIRSWPVLLNWLYSVWLWLLATLPNILGWLAQTIVLGLTWFFLSGGNLVVFTGYMLTYFIQAALDFLNWLGFDVPDNVLSLFINGIIGIVNLLIAAWNLFLIALELVINNIINFWVGLWNWLVPVLSAIWSYVSGGSTLFANPLLVLVLAVVNLLLTVVYWVWANVFGVVNIPINFYYAFDSGVNSEAFAYLMSCAETNFWCQMLAGIQLVNQTSAHTLMYPIVIVGIIIGSIVVFWKELWALFSTPVS